jgi:putative (di)nucleoside polyphosphate hydrolase
VSKRRYRPCVGIALFNAEGLVFIGNRLAKAAHDEVDVTRAWQMPQGGIDAGEEPKEAARRELYEETNVLSVEPLGEIGDWLTYDIPPGAGGRWEGKYLGQTQKWFALRFTGRDSEIDVAHPAQGAHRPEFSAWRWERLERVPELIVPFKRDVYVRVAADFASLAQPA